MTDDPRMVVARRRVAAMEGFYVHAGIFVVVIALLVAIDMLTGGVWWAHWPFLGWGLGLIGHGVAVFGQPSFRLFSPEWEERKVKEIVDKMRT